MEDLYLLDELIENLRLIEKNGKGVLNFPKAFLSLALEIKDLKEKVNNEK